MSDASTNETDSLHQEIRNRYRLLLNAFRRPFAIAVYQGDVWIGIDDHAGLITGVHRAAHCKSGCCIKIPADGEPSVCSAPNTHLSFLEESSTRADLQILDIGGFTAAHDCGRDDPPDPPPNCGGS